MKWHYVNWHIDKGTDGLVPVGTTGESAVLSNDEHCQVVKIVVDQAKGRLPVIAGCGSNNTAEALYFHKHAHRVGADAALHVTGYYNNPSQEGIYRHFEAICKGSELPVIVYNIPTRTHVDITVETLARLARLVTVAGIKDATKDLARPGLEKLKIFSAFSFYRVTTLQQWRTTPRVVVVVFLLPLMWHLNIALKCSVVA